MAERPLECSECKKPVDVHYTEIVGKTSTELNMCSDCPVLQRKLAGAEASSEPKESSLPAIGGGGLCCGQCGTTLESVRTGHPMGCQECYEVFADILVQEMLGADKIYQGAAKQQRSLPLHLGRSPGEILKESPAKRLVALNEALTETLSREDYEQAAYLRDQIKALTEGEDGEEEG